MYKGWKLHHFTENYLNVVRRIHDADIETNERITFKNKNGNKIYVDFSVEQEYIRNDHGEFKFKFHHNSYDIKNITEYVAVRNAIYFYNKDFTEESEEWEILQNKGKLSFLKQYKTFGYNILDDEDFIDKFNSFCEKLLKDENIDDIENYRANLTNLPMNVDIDEHEVSNLVEEIRRLTIRARKMSDKEGEVYYVYPDSSGIGSKIGTKNDLKNQELKFINLYNYVDLDRFSMNDDEFDKGLYLALDKYDYEKTMDKLLRYGEDDDAFELL